MVRPLLPSLEAKSTCASSPYDKALSHFHLLFSSPICLPVYVRDPPPPFPSAHEHCSAETFRRGKDEVDPVLDTCLGWLERTGTFPPLTSVSCVFSRE